ncbi:RNA polymerase sigma factor [Pseudobacter ginsenosidimutans]|uniref:RNA polymerase sigma-70 factor (ECF subfamily) n=1 Tax=Pseudobacter ginsenosidimutans TaxID=661488 RepID=A0A4Q7MQL1_9BACT|nr:sigma-70 family RNA polymerase sigma factor [Pseudobacter ginsenosidimutans]QEC42148.1 sigma-70 family RNA polymerase sigma factor [Pseudobacter ginsenosidimutans]RZS71012.1 RNA polymerase sigma-70 factor (ECF subfamily) [Pseudobacter ginsenosidimutans]
MADVPPYNEKELLLRITNGDEGAFEIVYNFHQGKLYSAAIVLTRSEELAGELVQDVFLKLWLKRGELTQIQSLSNYLFIMLRNEVYDWFTRESRRRKMLKAGIVASQFPIDLSEDFLVKSDTTDLLEKGILRLPPQQQAVFRMVRQQGISREEVAGILKIDPNTVKTHLSRALKSLRAWYMAQNIFFWPVTLLLLSKGLH